MDPSLQRRFFVCSYGGSASWTISNFFKQFGAVHHIHSRRPPDYLTEPVSRYALHRWLNYGVREQFGRGRRQRIEKPASCRVLYLYVKPVYAIFSRRTFSPRAFKNIGVPWRNRRILSRLSRSAYLKDGLDLIGYEQFFENYVTRRINQNYAITAVNVHQLWSNLEQFFEAMALPQEKIAAFPAEQPRRRMDEIEAHMDDIYADFNQRIDAMPPVSVIDPGKVSSSS